MSAARYFTERRHEPRPSRNSNQNRNPQARLLMQLVGDEPDPQAAPIFRGVCPFCGTRAASVRGHPIDPVTGKPACLAVKRSLV